MCLFCSRPSALPTHGGIKRLPANATADSLTCYVREADANSLNSLEQFAPSSRSNYSKSNSIATLFLCRPGRLPIQTFVVPEHFRLFCRLPRLHPFRFFCGKGGNLIALRGPGPYRAALPPPRWYTTPTFTFITSSAGFDRTTNASEKWRSLSRPKRKS